MSISQNINSHIFTNKGGNSLMKEFEGVLQHIPHIRNLDAVVGFLRASGYFHNEASERLSLNNLRQTKCSLGVGYQSAIVRLGETRYQACDYCR